MDKVWYKNPCVLFENDTIFPFGYNSLSPAERINSIARTAIILIFVTAISGASFKSFILIILIAILLTLIIIKDIESPKPSIEMNEIKQKESFQEPAQQQTMALIGRKKNKLIYPQPLFPLLNDFDFVEANQDEVFGRDQYSRNQLRAAIGEYNNVRGIRYGIPDQLKIIKHFRPQTFLQELGY